MARRILRSRRAIVTGASSGIGRALAKRLAAEGAHLLLTARREERLRELASDLNASNELIAGTNAKDNRDGKVAGAIHYIAGDISDPALREKLTQWVESNWGGLDLLINNAGIGAIGPFADGDEARLRRVMEVNFFAPVELARVCLPQLANGESPMIVNVGSVLGHRGVPTKVEYCASKFAMHGFSDAWRAELAQAGIDVLLVSPSTTASEFFDGLEDGSSSPSKKTPSDVGRRGGQARHQRD